MYDVFTFSPRAGAAQSLLNPFNPGSINHVHRGATALETLKCMLHTALIQSPNHAANIAAASCCILSILSL